MSSSASLRDRVAAELRAELARQRKTGLEVASLLNITQQSASRRLRGEVSFDLDEIETVATWLGLSVPQLMERAKGAVA